MVMDENREDKQTLEVRRQCPAQAPQHQCVVDLNGDFFVSATCERLFNTQVLKQSHNLQQQ